MMKKLINCFVALLLLGSLLSAVTLNAQALRIPEGQNLSCKVGRKLGVTDINISWNAPSVRGRQGKIWGTSIVPYGFTVLGFGSNVESPWRAGSDECTTMSFSTDVNINGKALSAGKYAFFIAVYPDSCVLIFNKNATEWGSYFYDKSMDVLRVTTIQQKDQPTLQELLTYSFENQAEQSVNVVLSWENWKIPFTVTIDLKKTTLADIKAQMSGALGFDPPSLIAAANWCVRNDINLPEALNWIKSATDPSLGGINTFNALSTRAKILEKMGNPNEAADIMKQAIENGSAIELHLYGRQLLNEKKTKEAIAVFEMNHKKHSGAWPTNVGLMRGYSAMGNLQKALEYAKLALPQAPDDLNKKSISDAIKKLESGKSL